MTDRYHCHIAQNGRQALDIFIRERPALVFLDVSMPDLDGIAVLEEIKMIDPDVPVVMISGLVAPYWEQQAMDSGAMAFLLKPVPMQVLRRILRDALLDHCKHTATGHQQPNAVKMEARYSG